MIQISKVIAVLFLLRIIVEQLYSVVSCISVNLSYMLVIFTVHLLQKCIFLSACFQHMKTVDFLCRNTWVSDPYDIVQDFAHAFFFSVNHNHSITNTCKTEFSPTLCSYKKPCGFILLF